MAGNDNVCVRFRLGAEGFGLPLAQVREISTVGALSRVPLAPAGIKGLLNLRGRVVTLLDVARIFGRELPAARSAEDRLALVLSGPWEHLGLYVHAPVEIAQAAPQAATVAAAVSAGAAVSVRDNARPESSAPGRAGAAVLSVMSGQIIHVLSAGDLVAYCEARILEGFRRRN